VPVNGLRCQRWRVWWFYCQTVITKYKCFAHTYSVP